MAGKKAPKMPMKGKMPMYMMPDGRPMAGPAMKPPAAPKRKGKK